MSSFILFFLLSFAIYVNFTYSDSSPHTQNQFEDFITQHNKVYDILEYLVRFDIFQDNVNKMNEDNKVNPTSGVNEYTDMTYDEFAKTHVCFKDDNCTEGVDAPVDAPVDANPPDKVDLRDFNVMVPVKNQGNCGSCYSYAASDCCATTYNLKNGGIVSLSPQQCVSCDTTSNGCHGGYPHACMQTYVNMKGCAYDKDYPYVGKSEQCKGINNMNRIKVKSGTVLRNCNEDVVKTCLAKNITVISAITMCNQFKNYKSGIYSINCPQPLAHAIMIVGYGSEKGTDYWIVKNSWGTNWGEKGYVRMKRGSRTCDICRYCATCQVD